MPFPIRRRGAAVPESESVLDALWISGGPGHSVVWDLLKEPTMCWADSGFYSCAQYGTGRLGLCKMHEEIILGTREPRS